MTSIRKDQPPPHVVIVDTNILWHKDKGPPVNPDFERFWAESISLCNLELVIPEVVREELLFQQVASATKAHQKMAEYLREISGITARTHGSRLSDATIRKEVVEKVERWIRAKRAKVAPTPISLIDWRSLIESAVWRVPPFASDPKNPDCEKGFRDALILETILDTVRKEPRKVNIAFLCNDELLRKTTHSRLQNDPRFSAYETTAEFSSFLKLTNEKLTSAFIRSILDRAIHKFYSPSDPSCLYVRERIYEKVCEEFKDQLENPEKSRQDYFSALGLPGFSEKWVAQTSAKVWLSKPEFVSLQGQREYHWNTPTTFVRLFKAAPSGITLFPTPPQPDWLLILVFAVLWKANVKLDGRFHDVAFESIQLAERTFRLPTEDDKKKFRLEQADA